MTAGEVLISVTSLEFFYTQAPRKRTSAIMPTKAARHRRDGPPSPPSVVHRSSDKSPAPCTKRPQHAHAGIGRRREGRKLALVRAALGMLPPDVRDEVPEEETFDAYNDRLDSFSRALSFAAMELLERGAQPGRNDMLDLAHFLYIPQGTRLATTDRRMRTIASQFLPVVPAW